MPVKVRVQLRQRGTYRFQLPLSRLLGQARQKVLVVVAEGTPLPADVLQVPLGKLLLGDDVPLRLERAAVVEPAGQIDRQCGNHDRQHDN